MRTVSIEEIDLNNSYFHLTLRENLPNIEKNGLIATCGDASKMVADKSRVCLSQGGKGLLGIKNSFIYEFKKLRICDIPLGYRKYFSISDYASTLILEKEQVYEAMRKRFQDECYLLVNAVLGEDFLKEEIFGLSEYDIKGIEKHNIDSHKLSLLTSDKGSSGLDIIRYVYNRLQEVLSFDLIKEFLGDLVDFFDYIDYKKELESDSSKKL